MVSGISAICRHCKKELTPNHTGKCPYCGETGKEVKATAIVAIGLKVSVSAEKATTYFEWFRKPISEITGTILLDIVIAIACAVIGIYMGELMGVLLGVIIGVFLNSLAIILLNLLVRNKAEAKIREITKIQENEAVGNGVKGAENIPIIDDLWNATSYAAIRTTILRSIIVISVMVFGIVIWFTVEYISKGLWELEDGLTFIAIVFIGWAGIVHLSNRLSMNKADALAICRTDADINLHSLAELAKKIQLGRISVIFLVMGILSEMIRLGAHVLERALGS